MVVLVRALSAVRCIVESTACDSDLLPKNGNNVARLILVAFPLELTIIAA